MFSNTCAFLHPLALKPFSVARQSSFCRHLFSAPRPFRARTFRPILWRSALQTTDPQPEHEPPHPKESSPAASDESSQQPLSFLGSIGLLNPAAWPERFRIVFLCFLSFIICNCDRINISVAILPMAKYYGWSQTTVGIIQSSFFWGYVLTQIPGGYLADKYGGKHVLAAGVVMWSVMTFITPIAASSNLAVLLLARALLGVGEGVAMPAMNNIISKWVPERERARSLSLTYSGMYLGSVVGLWLCPNFILSFGWQSVFYIFGSLGLFWWLAWQFIAASTPQVSRSVSDDELSFINDSMQESADVTSTPNLAPRKVPWRMLISEKATWAIIIAHFCTTWGKNTSALFSLLCSIFLLPSLARSGCGSLGRTRLPCAAQSCHLVCRCIVFVLTAEREPYIIILRVLLWPTFYVRLLRVADMAANVLQPAVRFRPRGVIVPVDFTVACHVCVGKRRRTDCRFAASSRGFTHRCAQDDAVRGFVGTGGVSGACDPCRHAVDGGSVHDRGAGARFFCTKWRVFQPPGYWTTVRWGVAWHKQHGRGHTGHYWSGPHRVRARPDGVVECRVWHRHHVLPPWHRSLQLVRHRRARVQVKEAPTVLDLLREHAIVDCHALYTASVATWHAQFAGVLPLLCLRQNCAAYWKTAPLNVAHHPPSRAATSDRPMPEDGRLRRNTWQALYTWRITIGRTQSTSLEI